MAAQNTIELKDKIVSIIDKIGPCLPSQIAKETGLSILFASAFLSELISDNKIKMSFMRIGSSPIYFIPGQELLLEKFSDELKSKEREAFSLLKEKSFLKDREQTPAIRVALREIKDFAVPLKKGDEIYWRYFKAEGQIPEENKGVIKTEDKKSEPQNFVNYPETTRKEEKKNIQKKVETKVVKKKTTAKKSPGVKKDRFFEKVKDFLLKREIDILGIEDASRNEMILKVRSNGEENLLFAYNKKKINENDLIKSHKKAEKIGLKYIVISNGESPRKLNDLINAAKAVSGIEKLE